MRSGVGYLDPAAIAPTIGPLREPNAGRMFIVGRSGSGKTFLAHTLLKLYTPKNETVDFRAHVVAFDPNGVVRLPNSRVIADPAKLVVGDKPVIYRPHIEHLTAEGWNYALRKLFVDKRRILLYIDELTALETLFTLKRVPGGNMLTAWFSRGRALGKGAIVSTQAPVSVPLTTLRNAERYASFDLPLSDDRDRMARVIGEEAIETHNGETVRVSTRDREALGRYEFWFGSVDLHYPIRMKVAK